MNKTWSNFLRDGLIVLAVIGALLFISIAIYKSNSVSEMDKPCQDTSTLINISDSPHKCHPKAKLQVYWGGAIPAGQVLDICTCQ